MVAYALRDRAISKLGAYRALRENADRLAVLVDAKKRTAALHEEAAQLAKACMGQMAERAAYLEEPVSAGLSEMFGKPYRFILRPVVDKDGVLKGLEPLYQAPGGQPEDPLEGLGASSAQVGTIVVDAAMLSFFEEHAQVLVVDEPFSNVNAGLHEGATRFMRKLSEETGLQIISATHYPSQGEDVVYGVWKEGTVSRVRRLDGNEQ